jgi:uncharacterized tellurite resistance protein B-like protein
MFLHILNDSQQKAFLALAKRFIEADSQIAEEEQNTLELMYAEMNLSFDEELPSGETSEMLAAFDTRQARVAALLELISTGHADNSFDPAESEFIRQAAAAWGIAEAEVARMESWIQRQQSLIAEAESFWAEPAA